MATAGSTFTTGNSTVAKLPAGSTLKVLGNGSVQVVSVPEPTFNEGDKVFVTSKGRYARIVRMSSLLTSVVGKDSVLYIADGTSIVRSALKANVKKI